MENIKEAFDLRNIQFKDAVASCKENHMETANIINLIVIVMTEEKEEEEEKKRRQQIRL